jgi:hypothetical protein
VLAALLVALVFGWAQLRPSAPGGAGSSGAADAPGAAAYAQTLAGRLLPLVVRDDTDDNTNDDNNDDGGDNGSVGDNGDDDSGGDNGGSGDNGDDDSGNSNNSNSDDSSGNGNGNGNSNDDDGGTSSANGNGNGNEDVDVFPLGTPTSEPDTGGEDGGPQATVVPVLPTLGISLTDPSGIPDGPVDDDSDGGVTEANGTSDGGIVEVGLGQRVVVRIFPSLPSGTSITLRLTDPNGLPPVPGGLAGDLIFTVEAFDAAGRPLASLPAEVNLNVHYRDDDVSGLDAARLEIVHLDGQARQWRPAPKPLRDLDGRFVAASITDLGAYAVHAP